MRRVSGVAILAVLMGLALPAVADHVDDGGVDQPWTNAMNQESYWESEFGPGADCTKYERHNGFIPEQYDAAVIKDGNMVRVYANVGGAFTAIGAVNPANGQHFGAPHSWVMKCTIDEEPPEPVLPTVTSTCDSVLITDGDEAGWFIQIGDIGVAGSGGQLFVGDPGQPWAVWTSEGGDLIASGVFEECTPEPTTPTTLPSTTTTEPEATTTPTDPETSTTITIPPETGTSEPPATTATTVPAESSELAVLPFTGIEDWLAYLAGGLTLAGVATLGLVRRKVTE